MWDNSSIKKLRRAVRTGRMPEVMQWMRKEAITNATIRKSVYLHSSAFDRWVEMTADGFTGWVAA